MLYVDDNELVLRSFTTDYSLKLTSLATDGFPMLIRGLFPLEGEISREGRNC